MNIKKCCTDLKKPSRRHWWKVTGVALLIALLSLLGYGLYAYAKEVKNDAGWYYGFYHHHHDHTVTVTDTVIETVEVPFETIVYVDVIKEVIVEVETIVEVEVIKEVIVEVEVPGECKPDKPDKPDKGGKKPHKHNEHNHKHKN